MHNVTDWQSHKLIKFIQHDLYVRYTQSLLFGLTYQVCYMYILYDIIIYRDFIL